jgi:hypothetical protein
MQMEFRLMLLTCTAASIALVMIFLAALAALVVVFLPTDDGLERSPKPAPASGIASELRAHGSDLGD